jgi:hypothetical protein
MWIDAASAAFDGKIIVGKDFLEVHDRPTLWQDGSVVQ